MDFFSYWIHRTMAHTCGTSFFAPDGLAGGKSGACVWADCESFCRLYSVIIYGLLSSGNLRLFGVYLFSCHFYSCQRTFPFSVFSLAACNARVSSLASFLRKRGVGQKLCRLFCLFMMCYLKPLICQSIYPKNMVRQRIQKYQRASWRSWYIRCNADSVRKIDLSLGCYPLWALL